MACGKRVANFLIALRRAINAGFTDARAVTAVSKRGAHLSRAIAFFGKDLHCATDGIRAIKTTLRAKYNFNMINDGQRDN